MREIDQLHKLSFKEIIDCIDENYTYEATAFKNGNLYNEEDQNQGSAKVFFFAKMNNLSKEDTLKLFAEHYQNVLVDENGVSHQNIRNFIEYGWEGIVFEKAALQIK